MEKWKRGRVGKGKSGKVENGNVESVENLKDEEKLKNCQNLANF